MVVLPKKELFNLPDDIIYLDGNSLGPVLKAVPARISEVVTEQWGGQLIQAWNRSGWMNQPSRVGDRVGRLIGAPAGSVVVGDTLSIKVYQALAAAIQLQPERRAILSDVGNFPSDLYMAQGLIKTLARGHTLRTVDPEAVVDAIDSSVAAVLLTEVDYRTGRRHDMATISRVARAQGAVMIWDLAHSAGAVPVDVGSAGCEFAVGCTYKYLNAGPGSPAFIYVRPDLISSVEPALAGWMGHDAPFGFEPDYRPASSVERMRVGTPPVLQMSALEAALEVWDGITIDEVYARSVVLSERFVAEIESQCPALTLVSPRAPAQRGSHVAFAFEHGYAATQALIARGVIGDFRAPDIMRFGFAPLYLSDDDVVRAAAMVARVVRDRLWDRPEFKIKKRVT